MFRTLGINLARSIICNLIFGFTSVVFSMIVGVLLEEGIFNLPKYDLTYIISSAICTGILTVILVSLAACKHWKFIFGDVTIWEGDYWSKRIEKKRPLHAFWVYTSLLLHLAIAAGCIVILHYYRGEMTYCMQNKIEFVKGVPYEDTALFIALPASAVVFQVAYYFMMTIHYGHAICHRCKHIFCLYDTALLSTDLREGKEYKTETTRVRVGSIKAGSTEVARVYQDVASTYSRDVKIRSWTYACRCGVCNASSQRTEYEDQSSDWK